ncbi:MAG: recombinase family protein, partial [Desulfobacterales bacterium]|nr:recombinase family protein [Desulfobacterales bacterium]
MLRAAIYSRHSTDQQNPRSAADQTRLCRSYAESQGWQVVESYEDHAISGASKFRPEYQRLTLHAKAGRFDIVVCEALDRLGRKLADIAEFHDQLSFRGVTIHSVQQGPITPMHIGLLGTMAQMQLSDIRSKTTRGLRAVAQDGRSAGGLCYGYKAVAAPDAVAGKTPRGHRAIDQGQAIVVRRIFQDYGNGLSPKAIALKLNGEGIPAPRGGTWAATAINGNRARGTGILNNVLYVGRQIWGRQTWLKDPSTGRRLPRMAKPEAQVVTEIPELRIVSDELWHEARARQALLDRRGGDAARAIDGASQAAFWSKQRPRYLFSGLMQCGQCGGGFSKISADHFGCSTARNKGPAACLNRLTIRRDVLEQTVLSGLRERLMDPLIFSEFVAGFTQSWNQLQADASAGLSARRQELLRVGQQIERGVDAILNGAALAGLNERLAALE